MSSKKKKKQTSTKVNPEKEMTPEEMKKAAEARKKDWDDFVQHLADNPEEVVTKGELAKAIQFIVEDVQSIASLVGTNLHNTQVLYENFSSLVQALGIGNSQSNTKRTSGGIVLP